MKLPDPSELGGEARGTYESWRHFGLSENAAMLEVVRAGHIQLDEAELETARFERDLRGWGVNESIARAAARVGPRPSTDHSSVLAAFGLSESDPLRDFRPDAPAVRESGGSTGAPTVLGGAARQFAEALIARKGITQSEAVDEAVAEAEAQMRAKGSEAAAAETLRFKASWLREGATGERRRVTG